MIATDNLETKIQDGYIFSIQGHVVESLRVWREAFELLVKIGEENEMRDLSKVYEFLGEEENLLVWFKDFQSELTKFGDLSHENHKVAKNVCEMYFKFFSEASNSDMSKEMGKILAQSNFALGDIKAAEDFFGNCLKKDSHWIEGWIAWVDCWLKYGEGFKNDYVRALNILNSAKKHSSKAETKDVYERYVQLYQKLEDQEKYSFAKGKFLELSLEDYVGDFF
jgi:tetratricopeptide (TPR) repeat protein